MSRFLLTLTALGLAAAVTFAAEVKYPLTGDDTKIVFVGTKTAGKHEGGFKALSGTATVTDGNVTTLKIDLTIDADSIYSDDAKLTGHLKSPDFFNVKEQPKITFKSTKIEKGDKSYTITGDLTMLGKTKSVSFPASIGVAGDTLTISSEFKIDRTDWGMTYGKGQIDNPVALKVTVAAKKK
jgi:polyisoprenoid-binding protein YceI